MFITNCWNHAKLWLRNAVKLFCFNDVSKEEWYFLGQGIQSMIFYFILNTCPCVKKAMGHGYRVDMVNSSFYRRHVPHKCYVLTITCFNLWDTPCLVNGHSIFKISQKKKKTELFFYHKLHNIPKSWHKVI